MSASVFDHPWLSALFAAPRIAPLWSAEAQMAHLLAYEAAWTDALEATGRIGAKDAAAARSRIATFTPDIAELRRGTATDGVIVPALVRQLRTGLAAPGAVHGGATSQDVVDTALVLTLRAVLGVLADDLDALIDSLQRLERRDGTNPLMGRTRMQAALPVTVAHRVAGWRGPLAALRDDLPGLRSRALRLQVGGAVGDDAALGDDAPAMAALVAAALELPAPLASWQTDRTGLGHVANWLAMLCASLGKIGQDVALMALQGIDEVQLTGGGSSSAMPHKHNPVQAELLVTLARFAAGLNGTFGQALLHEQDRSGSAWTLEWMLLPQLTMTAGCATDTALRLTGQITRLGASPAQG
ncbi:MAG: 3-carboxy-cis,cis-muconate cycloisomerase [Limimaricola sp.]|uniref:3-carboxy-cis,cis-muconate cycloisomerase n=1 Tax=Limimaricola sp. TaxID=2211665 RepID=UPI001D1C2EC1|nr:3-carboxy-cis,cis-muconate cycloisomerase [Limimaricola sp.]MBI1415694.1 3-carboxy-cis,cis-muconate cycloisomerase [Limimaricola sp.]